MEQSGVAFDKVKLPAKSVNAYQKAKDEGDTLAMSNLAFKCLSVGSGGSACAY